MRLEKVLKVAAIVVGGALALALASAAAFWWRAGARLERVYATPETVLARAAEPAVLERGRHWAKVYCAECHGDDLGGAMLIDDPGFARLAAPNLTGGRGGAAARFDDRDWVRAIRHGVGPDGRPLLVMPADSYQFLSDEDLAALVEYLEAAPAVDRELPARRLAPVARLLLGAGALGPMLPAEGIDHAVAYRTAPPAGPEPRYGDYLVRVFGCRTCHGEQLAGGRVPGPDGLLGPDLTPAGGLGVWNEEVFLSMCRSRESAHMPWRALREMSDDELRAVWRYLASLPAASSARG